MKEQSFINISKEHCFYVYIGICKFLNDFGHEQGLINFKINLINLYDFSRYAVSTIKYVLIGLSNFPSIHPK